MSTLQPLPPPQRRDTFVALGWTFSMVALVVLAVLRAEASVQYNTVAGKCGLFVGALTGPLLLAALGWFVIQRVIRKRRAGFPVWVALIAVGLSAIGLAVSRSHDADAVARTAACRMNAATFGAAPAGWEYRTGDPADAAEAVQDLGLTGGNRTLVIANAFFGRNEPDGILVWFPSADPGAALEQLTSDARMDGADVRRGSTGAADTRVIDNRDGTRATVAVKGCAVVLVLGVDADAGDALAGGAFSR